MTLSTLVMRALRAGPSRWAEARKRRRAWPVMRYVALSEQIDGWARGDEAIELALAALTLPPSAVIVEIGSFVGSSAVLLAGARLEAGGGTVHCVDPFDASGDDYSVSVYEGIIESLGTTVREAFERNTRAAGVRDMIQVHAGTADLVARTWTQPIDMLFLDGDQSPAGVRVAFDAWTTFLKPGGVIALHNSSDRAYEAGHDGHRRVVAESVCAPRFSDIRCIGTTTFATKRH